ncbi:MAG: DUF2769 domain-containing protein [Chloroflexi bacterium]|nr:DUF2769 domain-containing protein [Chloroflexota bacterium]
MPKIEYSKENLQDCRCSNCPVRETSTCIASRVSQVGQSQPFGTSMGGGAAMGGMGGASMRLPAPQAVQMEFCSQDVGKSECTDLNTQLACNCPGCPVWIRNGLNSSYFCSRGPAA